jgi:hypothetical protein
MKSLRSATASFFSLRNLGEDMRDFILVVLSLAGLAACAAAWLTTEHLAGADAAVTDSVGLDAGLFVTLPR